VTAVSDFLRNTEMNCLLKNARLVDLSPAGIEPSDLRIRNGLIAERGPDLAVAADEQVIEVKDKLLLPGLVNAHTHLYSTLARGMPAPDSPPRNFLEILEKIWWRLDRAVDEESIYYSALIGAIEAVRCGTTAIIDHHASPSFIRGSLQIIARALDDVGVRGVLCYEVTDRGGEKERDLGLQENEDLLRSNKNPLLRGLVGAHASFTLSDASLTACVDLAKAYDTGVHIHLAEDGCDACLSSEKYGRGSIVEHFAKLGLLSDRTLLAHCIHLSDAEIEVIKSHGCWVLHNARSNMNNHVGHALVHKFGDRVALGTDGFPGDMFSETQLAFFKGRDAGNGLSPSHDLEFLLSGHRLCSEIFDQPMGTITAGAAADLVILDYPSPTPLDNDNLASHIVLGMKAEHVTDVMVAGKFLVCERSIVGLNLEDIYQRARLTAQKLWARR
jgi:putative selenium metabolism protein SsnA